MLDTSHQNRLKILQSSNPALSILVHDEIVFISFKDSLTIYSIKNFAIDTLGFALMIEDSKSHQLNLFYI